MPDQNGLDASKQLLIVLNRLGLATEHLAKSIDNTLLFFHDVSQQGHDPVRFVESVSGTLGRIMDGLSGKKQRGNQR